MIWGKKGYDISDEIVTAKHAKALCKARKAFKLFANLAVFLCALAVKKTYFLIKRLTVLIPFFSTEIR